MARLACPEAVPDGKIRLGYFSADLNNHAVAYLIARVFELHDREKFEIFGYSFGTDPWDAMRRRISKGVDHFHDVSKLSDEAAAALARSHGIDIAIDLTGYTHDERPGIFAHQAAPVQINYLGYPGSMGAEFIDYIIADPMLIPESHRQFYSEKIIYLPHSYQANDDQRAISAAAPAGLNKACRMRASCFAVSTRTSRSRRASSTSGCGCSARSMAACCGC